jgi:hypothetical protein
MYFWCEASYFNGAKLMNWPVIIKHSDDAELIYVSDQSDWDKDDDLHHFDYHESDYLVDSSGNIFSLTTRESQRVRPEPRGKSMPLPELLGLIKAHAAQKGSCCVAKLYAPTIGEAFKIVASLNDA